jgi:hypothetical protein
LKQANRLATSTAAMRGSWCCLATDMIRQRFSSTIATARSGLTQEVIPAMLTQDLRAIRQDFLCYFMHHIGMEGRRL